MLRTAVILIAVLAVACATRAVPTTADPETALRAIESTAPAQPLRLVFEWAIRDGEARFTGAGVARVEPPYRARLDLFGPRDEAYLSAALVDGQIRLHPGVAGVPLPPPALMWAVLGVVRPPAGAALAGTRSEGERTELHYAVGGSRVVYVLEAGRLRSAEWGGDRRQAVRLGATVEAGVPEAAAYRDWTGNMELTLNLERADAVETYPPEIWTPDA